ncbi:shikimate kinase [Cyclobacterium amurskyense]|uniref:Shikimate kinase n=1 Tax=Cyclobacterium amurskyense TaxID=320787 RepID=A0A0H4PGB5_9BACT|nr:shikimate kinase [Cyclobacterium amurskyense]AKP51868.1 Shikimate kinase [Cyclobacterium amurskyense]|tara:strand:- start:2531 stop:3064 length:534 start_codon:yes stop_codon:yes gene_type:complete
MDPKKIVLVGMPGSGKSTLGKALALKLNWRFYDLDDLIEKSAGKAIAEIFPTHGEGYFRKLESTVLDEILSKEEEFVLATGGGAPCYNDNMDLINKKGVSVYLDVPLNNILERLSNTEVAIRPLFSSLDTPQIILKLKDMHSQRSAFYEMAKIKLRGEDSSPELLISEWMPLLKAKP